VVPRKGGASALVQTRGLSAGDILTRRKIKDSLAQLPLCLRMRRPGRLSGKGGARGGGGGG